MSTQDGSALFCRHRTAPIFSCHCFCSSTSFIIRAPNNDRVSILLLHLVITLTNIAVVFLHNAWQLTTSERTAEIDCDSSGGRWDRWAATFPAWWFSASLSLHCYLTFCNSPCISSSSGIVPFDSRPKSGAGPARLDCVCVPAVHGTPKCDVSERKRLPPSPFSCHGPVLIFTSSRLIVPYNATGLI